LLNLVGQLLERSEEIARVHQKGNHHADIGLVGEHDESAGEQDQAGGDRVENFEAGEVPSVPGVHPVVGGEQVVVAFVEGVDAVLFAVVKLDGEHAADVFLQVRVHSNRNSSSAIFQSV